MPEWVAAELPQVTCPLLDVSQADGTLSTLKGRWRILFDSQEDWVDYHSAKRSGKHGQTSRGLMGEGTFGSPAEGPPTGF